MSKTKQAELEDRAIDIAGKVLDRIENEILNGGKPKTIKRLVMAYTSLKPYF